MLRQTLLARLREPRAWDLVVVGGGATGLGVALDAAARGFSVVLLESHDFAKGTSSRATKLVHGGVRYLAQGDIALVREALHERTTLLANAPHVAQPLPFVVPTYRFWEAPFYALGLKAYDLLAGSAGLGATELLSPAQTLAHLPMVRTQGLTGGVKYWDGQFDDARLAVTLARTAAQRGALVVNYCPVRSLIHEAGRVVGVECADAEGEEVFRVSARCVVNATGVWVDALRQADAQALGRPVRPMVAPSQGVHVVVDREFLAGDHALMIPKTADGRVLFAVPWLGKLILGTTDTPRDQLEREPLPLEADLDFILGESARYLRRGPTRADVRSAWVGLRPLVKPPDGESELTKALSREHTVLASRSGLVTVTGGKWTTYRAMAEDVLQKSFENGLLPEKAAGVTAHLRLIGSDIPADKQTGARICDAPGWHSYGSEAASVQALPGASRELGGGLNEAMVRFAVREEFARTVEDVLARRSRLLFLDARLALGLSGPVEKIIEDERRLAGEVGAVDVGAAAFEQLAQQYALKLGPRPGG